MRRYCIPRGYSQATASSHTAGQLRPALGSSQKNAPGTHTLSSGCSAKDNAVLDEVLKKWSVRDLGDVLAAAVAIAIKPLQWLMSA